VLVILPLSAGCAALAGYGDEVHLDVTDAGGADGAPDGADGAKGDASAPDATRPSEAGADASVDAPSGEDGDVRADAAPDADAGPPSADASDASDASDDVGDGDVGDGDVGDGDVADGDAGPPIPVGLALGAAHSCALLSDHTVKCWGSNANGEIGMADASTGGPVVTPTRVQGLDHVKAIFSGPAASHTLALLDDGRLMCWGKNLPNENECNAASNPAPPTRVSGIGAVSLAAAGDSYSCAALAGDGGVVCWGWWWSGASAQAVSSIPLAPTSATSLTAGYKYSCASGGDGAFGCWGDNGGDAGFGNIGNARYTTSAVTPYPIGTAKDLAAADDGTTFACAAMTDGGVTCWGKNDTGQTGGADSTSLAPHPVDQVADVVEVTTGSASSCAREKDGTVKCWGGNNHGESGQAKPNILLPASLVQLAGPAVALAEGALHGCAIIDGGVVQCWGMNDEGQLGNGAVSQDAGFTIETVKF
jgi:alpha-tubulin suppressor-like RCC1 family protein